LRLELRLARRLVDHDGDINHDDLRSDYLDHDSARWVFEAHE
jgi:hypothetical protein